MSMEILERAAYIIGGPVLFCIGYSMMGWTWVNFLGPAWNRMGNIPLTPNIIGLWILFIGGIIFMPLGIYCFINGFIRD